MVLQCRDWITWSPILIFGHHIGILRIIVAFSFIITMTIVLFWSNLQIKNARSGINEPIMFQLYVKLLYLVGIIDLFTFILILIVETHVNNYNKMLLYCFTIALQHTITEGIAFIFMQKGCGTYSKRNIQKFALIWFIIAFISSYLIFMDIAFVRYIGWSIWFLIVIFYGLLWLLPPNILFRRPAAIFYGKFWFWYRGLMLLFYCFILLRPPGTKSWGYCGVLVLGLVGHALCHPLVIYKSLAEDSRWWQGILTHATSTINHSQHGEGNNNSVTDVRSPLLGVDFSIHVASALAEALDYMGGRNAVNILNFAQIKIVSQTKLLGRGSFSKVYRGIYKDQPCAVKLIFTSDLTEEVISRVTAEATILSAASSTNIVKIIGITVLPPSVCMVLELCTYGSLSDVLRGSEPNSGGRLPLLLKPIDKIFLALGCARGVAALHGLSDKIIHRDIKSFNFLVDSQLNAKLADLELGINTVLGSDQSEYEDSPTVDDFLVNWVAPEVLRGESFTQSSDIYSLSLVLFEIVTGLVPYDDIAVIRTTQRQAIKDLVVDGYRPDLSNIDVTPRYLDLIERGWSHSVSARPSAADMVEELEYIWTSFISSVCEELMHTHEVSKSINSWIQSTNGKDYIKSMTPQVYREERASIRQSLSTFQGVGRNPSFLQQHSFNEFSIQGLGINGTGNNSSNNNNSNNTIQLNDDFLSVQSTMNNNIDWIKVETVIDPICIMTSISPYLILKSSKSLATLLDYQIEDLFGQSLYTLTCPSPSSISMNFNIISQNKLALETFYNELNKKHSSHVALTLYTSNSIPINCIIYGFPIYYHEVVYREYYSNLVSVVPESIGTTFSSEYYDYQVPSKVILPNITGLNGNDNNNNNNLLNDEKKKNQKEILYFQLQFSKIEYIPRIFPEVDNTIVGSITRMFSTNSLRNSTLYQNRNTEFSSGSGLENKSGSSNRASNISGTHQRRSTSTNSSQRNNSQSTISLLNSSHGNNNNNNSNSGNDDENSINSKSENNKNNNNKNNDNKDISYKNSNSQNSSGNTSSRSSYMNINQHNSTMENILTITEKMNDDLVSERSLEYDSVEGGVMLERTNSGRSVPTDDGWNQKY